MKVKVVSDASELLGLDTIYLYKGNLELYKFMETLVKGNQDIVKLKITNYVEFQQPIELIAKSNEERSFNNIKDLLEYLDVNDLANYKIITKSKTDLFKLLQSLSYIQVFINCYTKDDLKWLDVYENLYHNIDIFKNTTDTLINLANNSKLSEIGYDDVKNLFVNKLNNIRDYLIDIKSRNLKVAVLASKKSGKSVFVNSLLQDWYSPTSLELPTPNVVRFIPSKSNKIILRYQGKDIEFSTPRELSKYVERQFIDARDKNEGLEDMEIFYKTINEDYNYETLDTPGPNLAGASKHREITERVIRESDVAIFLIDYTKHLESDEEEFLKQLKAEFEKYGKIHSFVIIVNKMDQRFMSEDANRSITRILDYIRYKLTLLGYHDFVVFGVSALQYFSALITERVCDECKYLSGKALIDKLDDLSYSLANSEDSSLINFAYEMARRYVRMEGELDITLEKLKILSGIPFALNYISAVAKDRAMFEKIKNSIYKMEEDKVAIESGISLIKLQLVENKERLRNILEIFENTVSLISKNVEEYINSRQDDVKSMSYYINDVKKNIVEEIEKKVSKDFEDLKNNIDKIKSSSKDDIYLLLENHTSKMTEDVFTIFNQKIKDIIEKVKDIFNVSISDAQSKLSSIRDEYNSMIRRINEIIKSNFDVDSFLPELKLDIQIKMEDIVSILNELIKSTSEISLDFDEYITQEKKGFLFFRKTIYSIGDLDSLIVDVVYNIKKHTHQVFTVIETSVQNTINSLKAKLDENIKQIDSFAKEQLEIAKNHIEEDSKKAKLALVELAAFLQIFQENVNLWNTLIKPLNLV